MAEELDIKSIWKKGKEQEDPSSLHINMMEKKGTKTTLYWIKTILWIEFWLTLLMGPFFIYSMITEDESAWLISLYTTISIAYLFYYQFLIKKIKSFSYDGNVIQSLKKVYGYLRFYLLHYKVVIWISMIIGAIYGFFSDKNEEALNQIETTQQWLIMMGVILLTLLIMGAIMHLLIYLIYGRKVKRLKRMVKDLERNE